MSAADISGHFALAEFASHDGAPYPAKWIVSRLRPLCAVLEELRRRCGGRPIRIVSGYRSPAHNAAVGGAARSQHVEGRAADIAVEGMEPARVYAVALSMARETTEIGGLGLYREWVHVDIRPRVGGRLALWRGDGVGAET